MVPQTSDDIAVAAQAKLADVERRLASDAAALTDARHRDGAERLAALRQAAADVLAALKRSEER